MGLFETYRIAGGERGMHHFLQQFGPSLKWEWTKLMDVPDLNKNLIDKIVQQSEEQSGAHSLDQLEAVRDSNIVGFLKILKSNDWGLGKTLNNLNQKATLELSNIDITQPMIFISKTVKTTDIDYNQHMTESAYLKNFSLATDAFLEFIGMDAHYTQAGHSVYTVETHLRHLNEVKLGEPINTTTQILGVDSKKIWIVHEMYSNGKLLATVEQILLHVNTINSCASPFLEPLKQALADIVLASKNLPLPNYTGRSIKF